MANVKIFGAGSIGNHLAHACRGKGWDVLICDNDPQALERTKNDIYPARYGKWDEGIRLAVNSDAPQTGFDVVIIGTPPDSHIPIVFDVLAHDTPKLILIEKPLATPSLKDCQKLFEISRKTGVGVLVGYNHTLTQNTVQAEAILRQKAAALGRTLTIEARTREHWGGIFGAHPWLSGPKDSYLGYIERGGGACFEHSHAINIWQHFSHVLGQGRVNEVSACLDMVKDGPLHYDQLCQINVSTERGLKGIIIQDVVTKPSEKRLRAQFENGALDWIVNKDKSHDAVAHWDQTGAYKEDLIAKTRPDDFKGEIDHVSTLLAGGDVARSPISLERGLETMMVAAAAVVSNAQKRTVSIDYNKGWSLDAIK